MRVLVLSNMYPPHHYGGYELSCDDVVTRWRERGHDVSVLTTDMRVAGVVDPPDERAAGVFRDLSFYWDDHRLLSPPFRRRLMTERSNQSALDRVLGLTRPDVVSIWNMGAMSLGLLTTLIDRGYPLVYAVCDEWPSYAPKLDAWSRLWIRRLRLGAVMSRLAGVPTALPNLGASGTFCFVTELMRQRAEETTDWHFADSTVVYSGLDERDFPISDAPPPARQWSHRWLYVGRIDERKGISTAVRALSHQPLATLDVIGGGDSEELERLHRLAESIGVGRRVRWATVPRSELVNHYANADVCIFPSEWAEPFGLVPVEAMACGTPVVATARGGSSEFLADGVNCLVFPAGDDVALAAVIARLEGDIGLRAQIVRNGTATARELTIGRLAEVLEAWHLGAAVRFAEGRPPARPLIGSAADQE